MFDRFKIEKLTFAAGGEIPASKELNNVDFIKNVPATATGWTRDITINVHIPGEEGKDKGFIYLSIDEQGIAAIEAAIAEHREKKADYEAMLAERVKE